MSRNHTWKCVALIALLLILLTACHKASAGADLPPAETPDLSDEGLYSPEPTPTPTPTPEEGPIVISMVGDCTLASSQYNDDFERVVGTDYTWPFAKVKEILAADDFTIANLEGSFSDRQLFASATFYFCAPTAYAQILSEGSVECATMGNNHTGEFGSEGIRDTEAALDAVGVAHQTSGVGTVYEVRDMKLGVYVSPFGPSESNVRTGVQALKNAGADIIIVCVHWGIEGSYRPTSSQTAAAYAAIDAGADVVCGTHPHVLQKTEEYHGGYIFYSLGNFSFGGNTNPRDRDTVIAQVIVEKGEDGGFAVTGMELIPCALSSKSSSNNYQPIPYEEGSKEYDRTLSKLDGTFTGPDLVVDYSDLHKNDQDPEETASPEPTTPAEPEPEPTPPSDTGTEVPPAEPVAPPENTGSSDVQPPATES